MFVFGKKAMRHEKEVLLKNELRILAIQTRDRLALTQKEMARLLDMTENSYSDIETGEYMCGTLTAILLLAQQDDPLAYLQHLNAKFKALYDRAMQPL